MMFEPTEHDTGESRSGLSRRRVLKAAGTTAAVGALGVGAVGSASAHDVIDGPVFCGCSQVCICVDGEADVLMARETDGGFEIGFIDGEGDLDPYPQGEPRYSGNFCVSIDDPDVPDGKIIAVQVAGTRWINPNQCAQKALAAEQEQLDSTHPRPKGDSGGPCGKPPCEHPGRGPPEESNDRGGGPPMNRGPQGNGPPM